MSSFVHLHVHSEYSLLDGAARINELTKRAAEFGMPAVALTDHGVVYGAIAFYKACRAAGVKPILGCEFYVAAGSMRDKTPREDNKTYHLVLLAKTNEGYRNLLRLCTAAHLRGFHHVPRIDFDLLAQHAEGLICLSGCLEGEVAQELLAGHRKEALAAAMRYRELFGADYYIELQDHGLIEQRKMMSELVGISREINVPLAATNNVHYMDRSDADVQDLLMCIGMGKTIEDPQRFRYGTDQMYFKNANEMAALFRHVPEATANTLRIAEQCQVELDLGGALLPSYDPLPAGLDSPAYLKELCLNGLQKRYEEKRDDVVFREELDRRLAFELETIERMGYADYFLITWDFVRFAHEQGIVTGPGRGSAAGSLVSYALGITDVDPMKYGLLFERFLNPARVSMPDIDIDFNDERRDEVIDYVVKKYGADRVAQIITFGTMAARAAVRDVGRALGLKLGEVDRVAKLIPSSFGITIREAVNTTPELKQWGERDANIGALIRMAMKVEGLPRHASTHAAGVVISREPLSHSVALQEGSSIAALTQFSMEHLESLGLLKMDFLGLRTLSIIERTLGWLREQREIVIDWRQVSNDDPAVYEMLGRGETTGVFQLESAGMRRVLREMQPTHFEDIISVLALYRPGPMEFIPQYIASKHGKAPVRYPHPVLEPILKDTYGIIVYQEQIMQIASLMAGFTLGEADLLRRAVSKKKREVLDEQRAAFVVGSIRQGYAERDANAVYDMIVRFADYGFPRAHATAYAVLAFQTAYLKAHYPAEFMAAMLTAVIGNHRKTAEYVDECRRMGIEVLPPDVNASGVVFAPEQGRIRFGLAAVKNVGSQAIESLLGARRSEGSFRDLAELCRRVDLRVCNKRVLDSLIAVGAADGLQGHRAQLRAVLDEAVDAAVKWKKDREDLQIQLFGLSESTHWTVELPEVASYSSAEMLELEKELLGLYLSGHPLDQYADWSERYDMMPIHRLHELEEGTEVIVIGMVLSVKQIITRKGQPMAFLEAEDRVDKVEAVLFPEVWKANGTLARKGGIIAMLGRIQRGDEDVKLIVRQLFAMDDPALRARLQGGGAMHRARPAGTRISAIADRNSNVGAGGAESINIGGSVDSGDSEGGNDTSTIDASIGNSRNEVSNGFASSGGASGESAYIPLSPEQLRIASEASTLFVKITPDKELPNVLRRLRTTMKKHPGQARVILFYEKSLKVLELNEDYRVKVNPVLIESIEQLLGKGTARVK